MTNDEVSTSKEI